MKHLKLVTVPREADYHLSGGPVRGQFVPIGNTEKFQSTVGTLVLLGLFLFNRDVVKPLLFPPATP